MKRPSVLFVLALAALPFRIDAKERPLARVGSDAIYAQELRDEFVRRHGGHAKFLGGESEIRAFLEQVIHRRLLLQEAYRLGLAELPEIRQAVDTYAENKAVERLVLDETEAKAQPTEEEIREVWKARTTVLYQVRQIVLPNRAAAEQVARELDAGADFETLVRERSIARSRVTGGMIAAVGWGFTSPEWEEAVFALEPETTSRPFLSPDGWEIVRMVAKTTVEAPEYAKARAKIEGILKQRKLAARRKAFSDELWAKYHARFAGPVELLPDTLAGLLESSPKTSVASWDGGTLTSETFALGLDLRAKTGLSPEQASAEIEGLLRQTVNDALVRLEARARQIAERPAQALQSRNYEEGLMEGALYSDYLLRGVELGDEEVRAWYDAHQAELAAPERRRVAHFVALTQEEAEAARQRIVLGENFVELVKSQSSDVQTRKGGGDLGWITRRDTPAAFEPVWALAAGELSLPLESKFGWHLIRVEAIEPATPRRFEEVRDEVRQQLLERKKTERRKEWIAQLREATPIKIDSRAIVALAAQSAKAVEAPPTPSSH